MLREPNCIVFYAKMPNSLCKEPPTIGNLIIEECFEPELKLDPDGSLTTPYGIPNRRWLQQNKNRIHPDQFSQYLEALKSIGK